MLRKSFLNEASDDTELFTLIQQGNKLAFTIIYEKYNKMLYAFAYRYLKEEALVEDAVQHIFVKLWESRAEIAVSISIRNYLYTMLKNYILNQIRNNNKAIEQNYKLAQQNEEIYETDFVEMIENKELMTIFYQAINTLPYQKKTVCLLKMDDKLSNQEIADKMSISINTVKTHYAQAIKMLRDQMKKMLVFFFLIILF